MDVVDELKSAHSFHGDPLHRKAWEEIERLRKKITEMDSARFMHDVIGKANWSQVCKENEILREEASKRNQWRSWSTVPENTNVLIAFYWKKDKEWYEEGATWDIGIGCTDNRNGRYVDIIHLDLEDFNAVWLPLPALYKREKE